MLRTFAAVLVATTLVAGTAFAAETAGTAGLALQIVGSGIAREQVPAPGSMVPPGTEIVVRFTR